MTKTKLLLPIVFLLFLQSCFFNHEKKSPASLDGSLNILNDKLFVMSDHEKWYNPYYYTDRKLEPYFTLKNLPKTHLFQPLIFKNGSIIFTGIPENEKNHELYLSQSPSQISEVKFDGRYVMSPCHDEKSGLFSFNDGKVQQVFHQYNGQVKLIGKLNQFLRCSFLNNHLYGTLRTGAKGEELHLIDCDFKTSKCSPVKLNKRFFRISRLQTHDDKLILIGVEEGANFSKIYQYSNGMLQVIAENNFDLVNYQSGLWIGSKNSFYFVQNQESKEIVVDLVKLNNEFYGSIADSQHLWSIGKLNGTKWNFLQENVVKDASSIKEYWIPLKEKKLEVQAFYFGSEKPKKIILYLKGGPRTNISSRYNYLFDLLNKKGYGVLAINYPGSTGRGQEYENLFQDPVLIDTMESTRLFLKETFKLPVVLWASSAGWQLAKLGIEKSKEYDRVVEVSACGSTLSKSSIKMLRVRGRYDCDEVNADADVIYEGGHELRFSSQVNDVVPKIIKFLEQ